MYKNFKHNTPIQVRFGDIDSMNHVNNAKYLTYIESARIHYIQDVLNSDVDHSKYSVILASANIEFLKPVILGDEIEVFTRCSRIGNRSLDLDYEIVKKNSDGMVSVAKARTILVGFNYETQQSVAVLDAWKEKISTFEGENYD